MIITVPNPWLEALLASAALLTQLGPAAAEDVMVILGMLLLAGTTLADVLRNGLVRVLAPTPGTAESQVSLACGQVVLSAFATDRHGEPVPGPHLRPSDVWRLAVADLAVGGISVLSQAAG
jgi:hypothetical protein